MATADQFANFRQKQMETQRNNNAETEGMKRHLRLLFAVAVFMLTSVIVDHLMHMILKTSYGTYWDLLPSAAACTLLYVYGYRVYGRINDLLLETVCLAFLITTYVKKEPLSMEYLRIFAQIAAQLIVKFLLFDFLDNTIMPNW